MGMMNRGSAIGSEAWAMKRTYRIEAMQSDGEWAEAMAIQTQLGYGEAMNRAYGKLGRSRQLRIMDDAGNILFDEAENARLAKAASGLPR
jgi:hypothetical protein